MPDASCHQPRLSQGKWKLPKDSLDLEWAHALRLATRPREPWGYTLTFRLPAGRLMHQSR